MKNKERVTITMIAIILWILFIYVIIDAKETGASEDTINILYIILSLITLVIFREPTLWYLRINTRINNQEEIIRLLKKSVGENAPSAASSDSEKE